VTFYGKAAGGGAEGAEGGEAAAGGAPLLPALRARGRTAAAVGAGGAVELPGPRGPQRVRETRIPGTEPMASKPEKRVASSVFITLAPPRRDEAVVKQVRRTACEARPGPPREPPAPMRAPGAGSTGRPSRWVPPGKAAAAVQAVTPRLSNGGCSPPPSLDGEHPLPDLDLLPPPPPPPPYLPDEEPPAPMGASLTSDLEQLHLPPPPPQSLVERLPRQSQPHHLRSREEELPPPPEEPVGFHEKEASTDVCAFCHKTVSPRELADTLEKCGKCGEVVREYIIRALGQAFHPTCFTCVTCARCIGDESFALDSQNEVYCLDDFYRKFAPVCSICENPIIPRDGKDAFKIECMGRNFHENCYRCEDCRILLSVEPTDQGCYPLNNRLFCKPCHVRRSAAGCC
ncbi:hypothetical protein MC885_013071, partial [Smutsia gigantea]